MQRDEAEINEMGADRLGWGLFTPIWSDLLRFSPICQGGTGTGFGGLGVCIMVAGFLRFMSEDKA